MLLGLCAGSAVHAQTGSDVSLSRRAPPSACRAKRPTTLLSFTASDSTLSPTASPSLVTEAGSTPLSQELAASSPHSLVDSTTSTSGIDPTVSVSLSYTGTPTEAAQTPSGSTGTPGSSGTPGLPGTPGLSGTATDDPFSTPLNTDESLSIAATPTGFTSQTAFTPGGTPSLSTKSENTDGTSSSGSAESTPGPEGQAETTPSYLVTPSDTPGTDSASSTPDSGFVETTPVYSATPSETLGADSTYSSTSDGLQTEETPSYPETPSNTPETTPGLQAETTPSYSVTPSDTLGINLVSPTTDSSSTASSTELTTVSTTSSTTVTSSTTQTSSSSTTSQTSTNQDLAVTVATDGSGDYTAINPAISYAQANAIPTVTVLAGTYTEAVSIAATATVTVVGATPTSTTQKRDSNAWDPNEVILTNGGAASLPLNMGVGTKGMTWRNVNFVNSLTGSSNGAVYIRGPKNAFYGCSFVSAGQVAITGNVAAAIIAYSYIEATNLVLYKYPSLYIFGSTITATGSSGLLTYTTGSTASGVLYNSTVVVDNSKVAQKDGLTNKNVYLFAANGIGSVALYRSSALGSFIAGTGAHVDSISQPSPNVNQYSEFGNTGLGSYAQNAAVRAPYVTLYTSASDLSVYDISNFFTTVNPSAAAANVDWIDPDVLSAIRASNSANAQTASTSSTSATTSSSATSSTVTSSTVTSSTVTSSTITSTATSSSVSTASTTSTSASASNAVSSCLPSSMPSTALIVGPSDNACSQYTSISAAVAALPAGSATQYVYILAGTYSEAVTIARTGSVVFRGETSNSASSSANKVTITNSNGRISSSGGSASTATFSQSLYQTTLASFYNINFVNSYPATTNYVALAVYVKALKVAFYGCNIDSSQGSLYLDYSSVYFSGGRISGTTDFVWGQGGGYFYNSVIMTDGTTSGQTIAAQKYQSSYGKSIFVFDSCAVVPQSSSLAKKSTYLGRDYAVNSNVAFVNSYFDAHIAAAGWLINTPTTWVGTFVEANNTGPGSDTSSRSTYAQILSDSSSYTVKNILGDDSWLDSSAIAPFSGWPDSVYTVATTSTTATSTSTTAASSGTSATTTSTSAASAFTVAPTPTGTQYRSVSSAIAALPSDGKDYTIYILAGTYEEQFSITRRGKVTLRGESTFANDFSGNTVLIKFSYGVSTSSNQNELTPVINWKNTNGDGLALYNLNFTNTFPQTNSYASLAADFYGTNMAAYGCAFKGFQDSLLVNQGVQVFSNSYIEGSVDFIWGYSKAYFHQCYIASNTANAYITAQNRPSSTWAGGFVFDNSLITYTSSYGSSFGSTSLGRPWSQYAIVVYMNSYLDKHISSAGWATWASNDARTDVSPISSPCF